MDSRPPRVARGWIIGVYAPLFGAFLWVAWTKNGLFEGLVATSLALLVAVALIPAMTTVLDEKGVSQLTHRGRRRLLWREVHRVTIGDRGSVLLECQLGLDDGHRLFSDFDATLRWLASRLDHVWPRS